MLDFKIKIEKKYTIWIISHTVIEITKIINLG